MTSTSCSLAGGIAGLLATLLAAHQNQRPLDLAELLGGWVGGTLGAGIPARLDLAAGLDRREAAHTVVIPARTWAWLAPRLVDLEARCRAYAAQVEATAPFWALGARLLAGLLRGLLPGHRVHLALGASTPQGRLLLC